MKLKSLVTMATSVCLVASCAGTVRSCSSCSAESFGGDWVVVQYTLSGQVLHCWRLPNTSIVNESDSDGIYWENPEGSLVHISNFYNRVQVSDGNWDSAYRELSVTESQCK